MVLKLKTCRLTPVWAGFVLVSVLTWLTYFNLSMLHSYRLMLIFLAVINLFLGVWILFAERFALRAVVFVVIGLVVGQWWLILWSIVFLIWGVKDFAP